MYILYPISNNIFADHSSIWLIIFNLKEKLCRFWTHHFTEVSHFHFKYRKTISSSNPDLPLLVVLVIYTSNVTIPSHYDHHGHLRLVLTWWPPSWSFQSAHPLISPRMVVPCYSMGTIFIFFLVQSLEPPPELKFILIDNDSIGEASLIDGHLNSSMFLE